MLGLCLYIQLYHCDANIISWLCVWSTESCMWFCEHAVLNLFFTRAYITLIAIVNISNWSRQCPIKWYNVEIHYCPSLIHCDQCDYFAISREKERIFFTGLSLTRSFHSIGSFIQVYPSGYRQWEVIISSGTCIGLVPNRWQPLCE